MQDKRCGETDPIPSLTPRLVVYTAGVLSTQGENTRRVPRDGNGKHKAEPRSAKEAAHCPQPKRWRFGLPDVHWVCHLASDDGEGGGAEDGDAEDERDEVLKIFDGLLYEGIGFPGLRVWAAWRLKTLNEVGHRRWCLGVRCSRGHVDGGWWGCRQYEYEEYLRLQSRVPYPYSMMINYVQNYNVRLFTIFCK